MFVEQVGLDAAQALSIVELDAHVVIQRTNGRFIRHQDAFGFAKDLVALAGINLARGGGDQAILFLLAPARSIVPAIRDEHIEEGIWIIVVSHPR